MVQRQLKADLAWGVRRGLQLAGALTLLAALRLAVLAPFLPPAPAHALLRVVGAYVAGGVAAGFAVGLARPLLRTYAGASAVGVLGGICLTLAFTAGVIVPEGGTSAPWAGAVLAGAVLGFFAWPELYQPEPGVGSPPRRRFRGWRQ